MAEPKTMGAYLRAARRRRRVSIERAAEDTKIRATFLMRMESDEFDFLAPAYVRGFLKSYARYLRVDPEPLLQEFDRLHGGPRVDAAQIVALQRRERNLPRQRRRLNSWMVASVGAILVLVLLAVVGIVNAPNPIQPQARIAANTPSSTPPTSSASPSASASPSPSSSALAFENGVQLKITATRARCWVKVLAADSQTVLYTGTLEVGQSQSVSDPKSMTVLLGNAPGVDLIVNGQNLGSPKNGVVETIHLPQDIKSLF
ncbi:MAG: helix-turn-helix domain-containing protein [Actinomycetota bacterium]